MGMLGLTGLFSSAPARGVSLPNKIGETDGLGSWE